MVIQQRGSQHAEQGARVRARPLTAIGIAVSLLLALFVVDIVTVALTPSPAGSAAAPLLALEVDVSPPQAVSLVSVSPAPFGSATCSTSPCDFEWGRLGLPFDADVTLTVAGGWEVASWAESNASDTLMGCGATTTCTVEYPKYFLPNTVTVTLVQPPPPTTTTTTTTTTAPPTTTTTTTPKSTTTTAPHPTPATFSPTMSLSPPLGPPGQVTTLTGSGFPPNSTIALSWVPDIQGEPIQVISNDTGGVASTIVVFPHDQLGPATLTGSGSGFSPATAKYLVVPNSWEPAGVTFNL